MKCFHHPDRDAVAICKSCSRALCLECTADVPPGVACRGKCEADVTSLNLMIERGKTAYQKTGAAYTRNAIATLLFCIMFLAFGLLPVFVSHSYGAIFMAPMGIGFLLWSFFLSRSGKQITEVKHQSQQIAGVGGPKAGRGSA